MKTLRFMILIFAIAAFTCGSNAWSQKVIHQEITVSLYEYDYSAYAPEIGKVSGTYVYHFTCKLNKAGYIESIHFSAHDFNLYNDKGYKVIVTDAGHDSYGLLWVWFNTPDLMNGYDPRIQYNTDEGWLDPLMPPEMPEEGVSIEMACKLLCKGAMFRIPFKVIVHINANGVTTVETVGP